MKRADAIATGLAAALVAGLQVFSPLRTATNDATLFAYGGRLVTRGLVPYRDFWDNKPPAIFYTEALGSLLGGGHWLGPTVLQALFAVATVVVAGRLLADTFESRIARWAGLFACALAVGNPYVTQGGNLTETYQVLPIALGAWLLRPTSPEASGARWAWAGAIAAVSFLYKPNGAAAAVVVGTALTLHVLRGRWSPSQAARRLLAFVAGGAAVLAIVTALFAMAGAAGDFWFATLEYNVTAYRELFAPRPGGWTSATFQPLQNPKWALQGLLACVALGPVAAVLRARAVGRDARHEDSLIVGSAWVLADLGFAFLTGYAYPHYFNPLAISLPFAAATIADVPIGRTRRRVLATAPLLVGTALVLSDWNEVRRALAKDRPYPEAAFVTPTPDERLAREAATYLREGDEVLTWGHHQGLALALDRRPATELLSSFHLASNYGWRRWGPQFEAALARRPVLVLETGSAQILGESQRAGHPELFAFAARVEEVLHAEYVPLSPTPDGHRVHVRRDRATPGGAPDPAR